ncbi:MAG TPA: hypothetical protein V6D15_16470 [Oculatellaceae cyanobacterium]
MKNILSTIGQVFRKSFLVLSLVSLLLSNVLIFSQHPAYAASKANQTQQTEPAYVTEAESYEEAVQEAQNPSKMDKAYAENVKEYKEVQPDKGLIEEAKELVEQVTGK